jgi:uncharacterized protein (DUF1778 family)
MTAKKKDRASYQRTRRKQGMTLVFATPEQKEHYQKLASASGMKVNPFILAMLARATQGTLVPAEDLARLRDDVERLTRWFETEKEQNAELRRQLAVKTQEAEDYRVLLALEGKLVAAAGAPGVARA